jgi:hypothetical protein
LAQEFQRLTAGVSGMDAELKAIVDKAEQAQQRMKPTSGGKKIVPVEG